MAHAPGVLLLIADDWSPLARCYGNDVVQTPHIDRLAERSSVFTNAFCTAPTCAASRASVLTGRHTHQHGQYGLSHSYHAFRTHENLADRTLPATLRQAEVFTGLLGKDHVAPRKVYPFDVMEYGNAWSIACLQGKARQFLNAAGDRPFFLQVASLYPHRVAPHNAFDRDTCGDELRRGDVVYDPREVLVPDWLPDHPQVRRDLAEYYTFVSRYDRFCGAILEELERSGRADDTMVICMSDHGMPFPGAKASSYDSGHRCPLIILHPLRGAQRNDALVNWTDIYPTVCDYLGLEADELPDGLPGRSLMPTLLDPSQAGWDETYFSHCFHEVTNYYPYRVVRTRRHKLVRNLAHQAPMPIASDLFDSLTWQAVLEDGLTHLGERSLDAFMRHGPEELYDIVADPCETTNLIDDPQHAAALANLRQRLQAFREATQDPWLIVDELERRTTAAARASGRWSAADALAINPLQ